MSQENKAIVNEWFKAVWTKDYNPEVIRKFAADDIKFYYPMHGEFNSAESIITMLNEFRESFPNLDFWAVGDLIAEGDYVVGRWDGGGTHTGPAFKDLPVGELSEANTGKTMRFSGTTVFKIENGKIKEELGQEQALTALQNLGLVPSK